VILTSDNPRTEEPLSIIIEAAQGLTSLGLKQAKNPKQIGPKEYLVEVDRRKAIKTAAELLEPGDILLIAGKGHETYQILGRQKVPFDDRLETLEALKALGRA
jgi:UDP-N-acetylmuramoyl-L-alanyl-D-glutamate--2,6-diaminopimelate ligase